MQWIPLGGAGAAGPSGTTSSVSPPNLVTASAAASYGLLGNESAFGFTGTITLPTSDPDYAQGLNNGGWIEVTAFAPGAMTGTLIATLNSAFTGSSVAFSGGQFGPQASASQTWTLQFVAKNSSGVASTPLTVSVTVEASAVTSVSASESPSSRTADPVTRLVYCYPSYVPVLNAGQVPQNVVLWKSTDGGVTYTAVGWQLMTAAGQSFTFSQPAPVSTSTWKVACAIYTPAIAAALNPAVAIPAASLPSTAVVSAGFSVAGLGLPAATEVTAINVPAGAGGTFPYNTANPDGVQYWSIPAPITYNDSGCVGDPNANFVRITAQAYDASGSPIGPEAAFGGFEVGAGMLQSCTGMIGQYGASNPPISGYSTNPVAAMRFRAYVCNRENQTTNSFQDSLCAVLQTGVGGGLGYQAVTLASGGAIPGGTLQATRILATTLDPSMALDPTNGLLRATSRDTTNMVLNGDFELGTLQGWTTDIGTVAVTTSNVFAGTYSVQITADPTAHQGAIMETKMHPCKAGQVMYAECECRSSSSATGNGSLVIEFYNASGTYISQNQTTIGANTAYQLLSCNATAPAGTAFVVVELFVSESTSGAYWLFDNVRLQQQTSTGTGTTANGLGGVQANLGYTMTVNSSNQIILNNLPAVSSLPTLPNSLYPQGSVVLLTTNSKIYRNTTGSAWQDSTDPADLVAGAIATGVTLAAAQISTGTLAAGVVYAGNIAASQIMAGTISASVTLTSPTLVITNGSVVVNIDATNFVKVTNTSVSDYTQMTYGEFIAYAGGNYSTLYPSGVAVNSGGNASILTSSGFSSVGSGSAFNGSLASAISAGKNVVGGLIVN